MTPRGTTYVTVGSHGFYYRETLSHRDAGRIRQPNPPEQPQVSSAEDTIATAASLDLVDSSSERLVQQLNERANMLNPAWILYVAAAICVAGLAILPDVPSLPDLPDATMPLGPERTTNTIDEYAALTARYGEPNSIVYTEADPLAPIPVGTAIYNAAHVKVVFVPNGCVSAYSQVVRIRAAGSRNVNREMKGVGPCVPSTVPGWTTVGYLDSADNSVITGGISSLRLEAIPTRQTAPPIVDAGRSAERQPPISKTSKRQFVARPEMKSTAESRLTAEQTIGGIKDAEIRTLYSRAALLITALGLFIAGVVVHKRNTERRISRLFYELDEAEQTKYNAVQSSLGFLSKCHRIWRIEAESRTSDWKRNAGASSLVRRKTIGVSSLSPPRVQTNVQVPCISMGSSQMYFFPDTIIYRDGRGYGAIPYSDLRLSQSFTRFIENEGVPADAIVVDQTWRYVNKNGGPDRRFNNNRQLPVLQFGVLVLASSKGLNIQLNTSNPQHSLAFANSWPLQFGPAGQTHAQRADSPPPPRAEPPANQTTVARKILGVSDGASGAEISVAYRHLAQMYHPDKVAGLAAEFQTLADKRMKEINAAYELLKRRE